MPSLRLFLAAIVLAAVALTSGAVGQTQTASGEIDPKAVTESAAADASVSAGPDIFLLPDATGQLRRVLGYRYEDFLKGWQASGGNANPPQLPKFTIRSLVIEAEAKNDAADARIAIEVDLQSSAWVEAPLELGSLIVADTHIEGGNGEQFVTFDAKRSQYVAWLKGQPGEQRTVRIEGQAVLAADGAGRRLELKLPSAAKSAVNLTGVAANAEVLAPDHVLVSAKPADADGESLQIEGAKGRLAVRWGAAAGPDSQGDAALEATVDETINVEPGRVWYEVEISVDAFGHVVDRLGLRLPPGTKASPAPGAMGFEVSPVGRDGAENGGDDSRPLVEIRFHDPSPTPPAVQLIVEPAGAAEPTRTLEARGVEVVGAYRQHGAVALCVSDQLHAHFDAQGRIVQIDADELEEPLLAKKPAAAFAALGPDWNLKIHTQPRQRQVRVTPKYEMHLGAAGATLEVTLDYQVSGGGLFELRVDLADWELSERPIESGGAIELSRQHVTPQQVLVLPLKDSDAEQIRVRFSLRREAGMGLHVLPMPQAIDAFALPGEVLVTCDDAWQAVFQPKQSMGVVQADYAAMEVPAPQVADSARAPRRPTLQLQTVQSNARVAVDVSERESALEVESAISAVVDLQAVVLEQRLRYEILHKPVEQITATVAMRLMGNESLELQLDGQPIAASAVDILPLSSPADVSDDAKLQLVVRLPRPTVGAVELRIRSAWPIDAAERENATSVALPLALAESVTASTALVSAKDSRIAVALASADEPGGWTASPRPSAAQGDELDAMRLSAAKPLDELPLRIEPTRSGGPGKLRVEAVWLQTWIAGGVRQDRCVYRIHSTSPSVTVSLPRDFRNGEIEAIVDGRVTAIELSASGQAIIPLATRSAGDWHALELRRQRPFSLGAWASLEMSLPQFAEGGDAPLFWQVVLPDGVVAVGAPPGLSSEYRVGWRGFRWGRQPAQAQEDFERWTGAASAPAPSPANNQYVFSAFEAPDDARVGVVRQVWLVVVGGILALGIGLTWLYTPAARSAGFWLAVCVAAVATLAVYPEAAMLVAQAAMVGGVLLLISALVKRLLPTPTESRSTPVQPASSVGGVSATTQPWSAEPRGSSAASVASAPSFHTSGSAS